MERDELRLAPVAARNIGGGMTKPIPSLRIVRRAVECETAYRVSRMRALERLAANPVGIAIRQLEGGAVALMARHLPVAPFNSVIGLGAGHEQQIEALAEWYRVQGVKVRFEIVPGYYDAAVGRELARLGYYQSDFHTSLVCEPQLKAPAAAPDIAIERIGEAAALDQFLATHAAGWSIADVPAFKANVRGAGSANQAGRSTWRGSTASRQRPPSSTSRTRWAIAPTPPPTQPSGVADCNRRCCIAASPMPAPAASISSAAVPTSSPGATATWSARECACCSCAGCGRRYRAPRRCFLPERSAPGSRGSSRRRPSAARCTARSHRRASTRLRERARGRPGPKAPE